MDEMEICKFPCQERECIIAPKIFDQCRLQVCLTPSVIGPARIGNGTNCARTNNANDNIVPPANAVSVAVRNFCVTDVNVVNKCMSQLRCGYWDVTVIFTFSYCLAFFDCESCEITTLNAYNTYTTTITLYGGENMHVTIFNELYNNLCKNGPFVGVEANAMALSACLSYPCPTNNKWGNCGCGGRGCSNCGGGCSCGGRGCSNCNGTPAYGTYIKGCECTAPSTLSNPIAVNVTIGLFAVVKLFRMSSLSVENLGDCVPEDCSAISPETMDPCEFFDSLDFPLNLFAPQSDYVPSNGIDTTTEIYGGCGDYHCGCGPHKHNGNYLGNSTCSSNNGGCGNGNCGTKY